ncbi:AAA family ATPase [Mycobacterium sp.]|uniref:AAA family ATPase n=1 Tax=Mycobacterium sp. TaxID=1785 RepID=UPI0012798C9E|nr:AAA family ATPase [Mycobacterium sp.]KAA8965628.1 MAG: AAA family ATPase [Mycobacterium sp.]
MKLHRIVLDNYRGIVHREISFPDRGVVIVYGANEIGKSSMIEAIDLLLESKDRSTKKDVKQVKPTNADVGAEVVAEMSSGPYRFVYRKRFHKKCETELTVLAPHREQLTGDEAHDRVRAMLAETLDTELWRAQRVLQAASTAAVELSGCDALSRALDMAAGDATALSGTESVLIGRIDAEYARYFTPTGRPTGEWADAIAALRDADEEVARCAAAVAEVDDRVRRHAELTAQLAELSQQQQAADARHREARAAVDRLAELTEQLREAKLIAATARATSDKSTAAYTERTRLRTETETRTAALAALQTRVREAAAAESTARERAAAADAVVQKAEKTLAAAQQRVDELARRDKAERLAARLQKIDAAQRDCDRITGELSMIAVTEEVLQRIEQAAHAVDLTESQLASVSATVEFTAVSDLELAAGDQRVSLSAGQSWSAPVNDATEIAVPGVVIARLRPGATALDIARQRAAAQQQLAAALRAGHVGDVAAARVADQRRRDLESRRDRLVATMAGLCGDDPVAELRAQLSALRTGLGAETMDNADLGQAEAARAQAAHDYEAGRRDAAAAAADLAEAATRAALLNDTLAGQQAELATAVDRLARQRAACADEELAVTANAALLAAQSAEQRVAELSARLTAAAPDAVTTELAEASRAAEALRIRRAQADRALHEITVELAVFGTEGRQSKLDAAEVAREHARSQYTRVQRRARAAQLLRSVMARHRDTTRLRYAEPFRAELQRLGRPVFGPSFEVDVDPDLRIRSRTLDGCTVPYESLSGGAKEQLGILTRLAGAALVAKEDTVPVLIDDALGFTDPDRLAKMGAVFSELGTAGQVIVLTCTPARYRAVEGARWIALSA